MGKQRKAGQPNPQRSAGQDAKGLPGQRLQMLVMILLIVIIGVTVWAPALETTARTFDDDQYFYSNALVQNPSWASAKQFLSEVWNPSTVGGYYQPLSMISLMLDVAMGATPEDVSVFHRTSMILHIGNALFIFLILWKLFRRLWAAWFTGLIFLCHPMVTETIAWIGERKSTLAAFFGLATILLYVISVQEKRAGYRWLAVLTFGLALMAKPTVLALPLGLLILDVWPMERMYWATWKARVLEKWPFYLVMLVSAVIAYVSQDRTGGTLSPVEQGGWDTIIYKMAYNIVLYVQHFCYPTGLTAHYPIPDPLHFSNPAVLWTCVWALILIVVVVWSLRVTRAPFFGMLYAMVVLLPASGIIGFNNVIGSDKYMYFPLLGYLMIVCWAMVKGYDRLSEWYAGKGLAAADAQSGQPAVTREQAGLVGKRKRPVEMWLRASAVVPVAAVMVYLLLFQAQYIAKWENTETFYKYMIGFAPQAAPLHYDLAMEYMRQKRTDEAIIHYERAGTYAPDVNRIQTNLGIAYFEAGKHDQAIQAFNRALELQPKDAFAANNLGIIYMKKNDDVNALSWFIKASNMKPDFFDAVYNRGLIYDRMNMLDQAMGSFQEAYKLNPGVPALHFDMGRMFEKKGMKEQALLMYQQTQQMQPDYPGVAEKIQAMKNG